ncbi:MAG: hypothetical protein EOP84_21940 [Verrucomicrobiaceae bacterium]|nr:MAG: hypothetical protein EOP84_21940 [Verrucomicrobiaceae bacterium]
MKKNPNKNLVPVKCKYAREISNGLLFTLKIYTPNTVHYWAVVQIDREKSTELSVLSMDATAE